VTPTITVAPCGEYLNALSSRIPTSRSSQSGGAVTIASRQSGAPDLEVLPASLGDRAESIGRLGRQDADVDRLGLGLPARRVESSEPEHVVDQPASPLQLGVDSPERRPVPGSVARPGKGQRRLSLDDRQRRPQFVRGVGGEFELALAGPLDRHRDAPADRQSAEEDDDQQRAADTDLGNDQVEMVWLTLSIASPTTT
jgi:hypothetical protein